MLRRARPQIGMRGGGRAACVCWVPEVKCTRACSSSLAPGQRTRRQYSQTVSAYVHLLYGCGWAEDCISPSLGMRAWHDANWPYGQADRMAAWTVQVNDSAPTKSIARVPLAVLHTGFRDTSHEERGPLLFLFVSE